MSRIEYVSSVKVFDGVDWYWFPSILGAIIFLIRQRPEMIVFQWWTGTVLHSYIVLALVARLLGARVIIEFHEVLDTGEAKLWLARTYVDLFAPFLMRLASAFVVHSEHDRPLVAAKYRLAQRLVARIPLGPFDHYQSGNSGRGHRVVPTSCCNLLYFGVIRPFKGLEDLVRAFDSIPEPEIGEYWLTVVGESWEGWKLPAEAIANSRYRDRITFVNRYVRDEEVAMFFSGADAVVLPYHRSSASGPLHTAMSWGLPVVVTHVGGLTEAVAGYEGAILVPPQDPIALRRALRQVRQMRGKRFACPHSWQRSVVLYEALFATLAGSTANGRPVAGVPVSDD